MTTKIQTSKFPSQRRNLNTLEQNTARPRGQSVCKRTTSTTTQPPFCFRLLLAAIFVSAYGCEDIQTGGSIWSIQSREAERLAKGLVNINELYTYPDPTDDKHYANVFQMSNGRIIAGFLIADSVGGKYGGDKLGIYDVTNSSEIFGWRHDIGPYQRNLLQSESGSGAFGWYSLQFVPNGNDRIAIIQEEATGLKATLSLNKLYQARILNYDSVAYVGDRKYYIAKQGGVRGALLFFSEKAYSVAEGASRSNLVPTYVVFVDKQGSGHIAIRLNDIPIGDSGYMLHFNEDQGYFDIVPER